MVALIIGALVLAYQYLGGPGLGFFGTVLGIGAIGSLGNGPKVPGNGSGVPDVGQRDREAANAVKESVRELERRGDELEATVERIESGSGQIAGTGDKLGSLADAIRKGVTEGQDREKH